MHWLPNFSAPFADEFGAPHRFGVDGNLVGAREKKRADVVERAHAAADGQRHEAGLGRAPHHVEKNAALLMAGGDVEKAQLVGARRVVDHRLFDRIAGIAQRDEIHALDDAAVFHVEAGDNADLEHVSVPARA